MRMAVIVAASRNKNFRFMREHCTATEAVNGSVSPDYPLCGFVAGGRFPTFNYSLLALSSPRMDARAKSAVWGRTLRVMVTVAALFLVFRRVNFPALEQALQTMRPGWFVAAICMFGFVLLVSAWRWHLVLRLTGQAVHPAATARLTLIGHFFYTILFG